MASRASVGRLDAKLAAAAAVMVALGAPTASAVPTDTCSYPQDATFPQPTVVANKAELTPEQAYMEENWAGYANGVSLGGGFLMEDWMFYRNREPIDPATLHLAKGTSFDQLQWNEAMLKGDLQTAYQIMDCHLKNFYSDADLDEFAAYGINAVRLPVGYWTFDDVTLYPGDTWPHRPSGEGEFATYGVNPDGFITSGTGPLTDLVIRLWNRNIKVLLDMHALPGCSSPHQSYAGVHCEARAPNTWNGQAKDGISGNPPHSVSRADDGKTWMDVATKIALERVVPWIKFVNGIAPGAINGYELVNEPDIASGDANLHEVRALTIDLGDDVLACLKPLTDVIVGIGTASKASPSAQVAKDYKDWFPTEKEKYVSDVHHYFNWAGCINYGAKKFDVGCACESNLPGTGRQFEDQDWANWMRSGIFEDGWRFYIGEWSAGLGTAHNCNGGLPTMDQAKALWTAQKWGFMAQYVHYKGKSPLGSSFWGDFYWNGRMGYNWDPTPSVCNGPSSATHYANFEFWDWSLLRLIRLGVAQPLSQLGWTPDTLMSQKGGSCSGQIQVLCAAPPPGWKPAPAGGQPGMTRLDAEEPGVGPLPVTVLVPGNAGALAVLALSALVVGGLAIAARRRHRESSAIGRLPMELVDDELVE